MFLNGWNDDGRITPHSFSNIDLQNKQHKTNKQKLDLSKIQKEGRNKKKWREDSL